MLVFEFLAEGFELVEASCPYDMLQRAGADVKFVSITKNPDVKSAQGVVVRADLTADKLKGQVPDMVILPGGMPGAQNLFDSSLVKQYVLDAAMRGSLIGAICAAPFILGRWGLLDGKKATCYPGFEGDLKGATHAEGKVAVDGNIITGIGPGASLEFAYALCEKAFGKETANRVMSQTMYL